MKTKKETGCLSQNLQKKIENSGKQHKLRKKNSAKSETQDLEQLTLQKKAAEEAKRKAELEAAKQVAFEAGRQSAQQGQMLHTATT